MSKNTIIVDNLTKRYGDVTAVKNISFSVQKGMLFGFLGPNGSGKTTMIKMLTGQIKPDSGTASVLDIDVLNDPLHVREMVGIVPEQETPPSFLTAEEYLIFVSQIRKIRDFEDQIDTWFHRLDFVDQKIRYAKIFREVLVRN